MTDPSTGSSENTPTDSSMDLRDIGDELQHVGDELNENERKGRYLELCNDSMNNSSGHAPTRTIEAALFSWSARKALRDSGHVDHQHALLGYIEDEVDEKEPVLFNTAHPWSAFICGSQGSGKSYTTSCILEGCLSKNDRIGTLKQAMAGLVFRYDRYGAGSCEAATLCTGETGVKVQVLLSPFNYKEMERKYRAISPNNPNLEIKPFYLKSDYLNAERIQKFMASGEDAKPLYMSEVRVVDRVLREIGRQNQGPNAKKAKQFKYAEFDKMLKKEDLSEAQRGPLKIRQSLIESYMEQIESPKQSDESKSGSPAQYSPHVSAGKNQAKNNQPYQGQSVGASSKAVHLKDELLVEDTLSAEDGCLKILDLTDPHLDRAGACALFDLALAVFIKSNVPKVIALDEAHNYLNDSEASDNFTEDLLKVVREQRHSGSRLIVATQEPTISPKFLDLCTVSIIHRFTSPDWFKALRGHLGGASAEAGVVDQDARELFKRIGKLRVGQSLVFSPTALLEVEEDTPRTLDFECKMMKTRKRISDDGGKSKLA